MDLFDHPPTANELTEIFSYKPKEALGKSYQGHDYLLWFWKEAPDTAATVHFIGYLQDRACKEDWPAIVGELIAMKSPLNTFTTLVSSLNRGLSHLDGLNTKPLLFQILLYALQEKDRFTTTRRETENYKETLTDLINAFSLFDGSLSYTQNGAQVLHLLMSTKYRELVNRTLDLMGDDVMKQRVSSRKNTWAHEAVVAKSSTALQWFAQHCPDIFDIPNDDGQTPAQLAAEMQYNNLVRYMKPFVEASVNPDEGIELNVTVASVKKPRVTPEDQMSLF